MYNLSLKLRYNKRSSIDLYNPSTRIRFNIDRLKDPQISHLCANKLSDKHENIETNNSDPTAIYTKFEDVIIITANNK